MKHDDPGCPAGRAARHPLVRTLRVLACVLLLALLAAAPAQADPPNLSIDDAPAVTEGDAGTNDATFTVSLSDVSATDVTFDYDTANVSATAPADYVAAVGGQGTIPAGQLATAITIAVNGDTLDEPDETFTLTLSNVSLDALVVDGQGVGTIADDDPPPAVSINNAPAASEGTNATFTVSLSAASAKTVTVHYATANGSAVAPGDYTSTSGDLTFVPGDVSSPVVVAVNADALDENDETFAVNLSAPGNATIGDGAGTGTILDTDAPPALSIDNPPAAVEGADATFTVSLTPASGKTVTVHYATANSSAVAPGDYSATSGDLTFAPGDVSNQIAVPLNTDGVSEPNEVFTVNLSAAANATISDATGTGTIVDGSAAPALSINNAPAATEGANATFTVSLTPASAKTVTVHYATSNGSAIAPGDYTATSGDMTFLPGDVSNQIAVPVNADAVSEPDETFTVTLSTPGNATISDATGTGTILDGSAAPALSINNAPAATEGANATFTVTLTPASAKTVTVHYATANATAIAPGDYTATSGDMTFLPGDISNQITVPVNTDAISEPNEVFTVNLTTPGNATVSDATGTGTIVDASPLPALSINNAPAAAEGANATFTVTLTPASARTVTVHYATANGTAAQPGDYTATSGDMTFAPGDVSNQITVPVNADAVDEPDETFAVNLTVPANATIADAAGTGTITDNSPPPALSINDAPAATEGTSATFTVSLTPASANTVTVHYATANGTAVQPGDYASTSGDMTFAPGDVSNQITVPVNADATDENNEAFTVTLSAPVNATIADATGTGTIVDASAAPALSINDVPAAAEGANATFTVSLTPASAKTVTVHYATANGTAAAPGDYTATSGDLTFAPGDLSKQVVVAVGADTLDENNETFTVNLSAAANATIADVAGTATILDDDPLPALAINNAPPATEGSNATFTVSLTPVSGRTVTVHYATANGTATAAGGDYTATSGDLTFAPGDVAKQFTVAANADVTDENDESFAVNLTLPVNATIADAAGTGTIQDNSPPPALSINNAPSATEGANATFTVSLAPASAKTVTVHYATADGTATQPGDYTATSGDLTFAPGEVTKQFTVPVKTDPTDENAELFAANLSAPGNATIADGTGIGTIADATPPPSLSIGDAQVGEGDSGTTTAANFTVTISAASAKTVRVHYATHPGTATEPDDYAPTSGDLTFAPGNVSKQIPVTVNGDDLDEGSESFTVQLTLLPAPAPNATLGRSAGTGTIVNDDSGKVTSHVMISDATAVTEGNAGTTNATFTVALDVPSPSASPITVDYASQDSSAVQPGDYNSTSGTVTFTPGETSKSVTVAVVGDTLDEPNEEFVIHLSNASGAVIDDRDGLGTILDDDPPPALAINDAVRLEGDTGAQNAIFTVSLASASGKSVRVHYATANGTALAPGDYTATSGDVTINPGQRTGAIAVPVRGDTVEEPDETFTVNLSAPTNATIADGQGVGTIKADDDSLLGPTTVPRSIRLGALCKKPRHRVCRGLGGKTTFRGGSGIARWDLSAVLTVKHGSSTKHVTLKLGHIAKTITRAGKVNWRVRFSSKIFRRLRTRFAGAKSAILTVQVAYSPRNQPKLLAKPTLKLKR